MKAPRTIEMKPAEVVVDNIRCVHNAANAMVTLTALNVENIADEPSICFEAFINGRPTSFKVTDVLVEGHNLKTIIATTGDLSREGDSPTCAIMFTDKETVQKLFIYYDDGIVKVGINEFTTLLNGA